MMYGILRVLELELMVIMNPGEKENIGRAVSALEDVSEEIRRLEAEAREALFDNDRIEVYRRKLEEKTMLLMELPDTIEAFLDDVRGDARAEIESRVNDFSRRAAQAWDLSSTFYMSALLYPDDYKEGEPNDLEIFVERLRRKYL